MLKEQKSNEKERSLSISKISPRLTAEEITKKLYEDAFRSKSQHQSVNSNMKEKYKTSERSNQVYA